MEEAVEIQKNLEKGLYVENVRYMMGQCMKMAKVVKEPLAFYVLASVLYDIAEEWDERMVLVGETEAADMRVSATLENVLDGIIEHRQPEKMWNDLNILLRSFLEWKA